VRSPRTSQITLFLCEPATNMIHTIQTLSPRALNHSPPPSASLSCYTYKTTHTYIPKSPSITTSTPLLLSTPSPSTIRNLHALLRLLPITLPASLIHVYHALVQVRARIWVGEAAVRDDDGAFVAAGEDSGVFDAHLLNRLWFCGSVGLRRGCWICWSTEVGGKGVRGLRKGRSLDWGG